MRNWRVCRSMARINRDIFVLLSLACALVLVSSCSSRRCLGEGEYLLDRVVLRCDSPQVGASSLGALVRQQPNTRLASVSKVQLGIYLLASPGRNRWIDKILRRMGEAPVIYDSLLTLQSCRKLQAVVRSKGYLRSTVDFTTVKKGHKISVTYRINAGRRYYVDSVQTLCLDSAVAKEVEAVRGESLMRVGMPYDLNVLSAERSRIARSLANRGFYKFTKEDISFDVDTFCGPDSIRVMMVVNKYVDPETRTVSPHLRYRWGNIGFSVDTIGGRPVRIRPKVLYSSLSIRPGEYYSETNVQDTYSRLNRLPVVASSNVNIYENVADSSLLDADIRITPTKLNSVSFGLDGTNTAGDFGVAGEATYQMRNLFRGGELLSLRFRAAFEAIRGLSGYKDQNFFEYNINVGLKFPDIKFPFLSRRFRYLSCGTSELNFSYDSQDRPEFHRRVLTAGWKYRWSGSGTHHQHRIDALDVNYVFMPWISDTFRDKYINNPESRNAIIAYNYQNLFIVRWGYQYEFSSIGNMSPMGIYGKDAYTIRAGVETAGNVLAAITSGSTRHVDDMGQRTLFGIAFAQYAKADFDFSRSFRFRRGTSLAVHVGMGVAVPYGNSSILPYEKRYYSGGANSVRGWSVRSLGPGSFRGSNGQVDFINQTGDVKLDLNVECRFKIFWKIDGAAYIDAGNIWTLRDYKDQPGGQFSWSRCWEQIAVSYGLGLRLNFDYFLLRFDTGMKAIDPAYTDSRGHYPFIHPKMSRDFSFHFAVGLPF